MRNNRGFILPITIFVALAAIAVGGYGLSLRYAPEPEAPVLSGPTSRQEVTLLPVTTSDYDLGSATKVWEDGYIENLFVTTCTGCPSGGSGSISTSSPGVVSSLLFYTTAGASPELVAPVATSSVTLSPPLTSSGTAGFVVGGSGWTVGVDTSGSWTGNAGTATALAGNGANCSSGSAPLGVDASGASESCFDVWTQAENTAAAYGTGSVTSVAMTVPTGLSIAGTPITTTGTLALTYASGYAGVLTASTTNWNSFYDLPSGVITAGDALTWSGNTINFDGGASPSGDLGGTWASPSVTDDSHAHTSTTISGVDISADTNLAVGYPVILTDDTLSLAFGTTTANSWSALQQFTAGASTTRFSVFDRAYFGGTATSSFDSTGALTLNGNLIFAGDTIDELVGTGLQLTSGDLQTTLGTAITSSEITDGEIVNADVSASAAIAYSKLNLVGSIFGRDLSTTTAFANGELLSYVSATDNFTSLTCAEITGSADLCDGSDATGGGGAWPFTPSSYAGVANQSSTTPLWLKDTMVIASTTLFTRASTTQLTIDGDIWATTLTSALLLTDGAGKLAEYAGSSCTDQFPRSVSALGEWTCAKVSLTADVSGILPIANGGTGASSASGAISSLGAATTTDIQVFTSTGGNTWTKPTGAKQVCVEIIAGGGGGGSGRKGAAGTVRGGGGGGSGGGFSKKCFSASITGATETVTVGAGGTGGASQTTNTTDGNVGSNGGDTSFGTWLIAQGGRGGEQGFAAGNSSVAGGYGTEGFIDWIFFGDTFQPTQGRGGEAKAAAAGGVGEPHPSSSAFGQFIYHFWVPGGGGGGGVTSGNAATAGGQGGYGSGLKDGTGNAGGTAGAADTAGGNGTAGTANSTFVGGGGGGGGGSTTTNAGAGGNGAIYGAGGGGGGAAVNSVGNSGAGGAGANGIAIITSYF